MQLKRKIFQIPVFWKKRIILEQANQSYRSIKLGVFAKNEALFVQFQQTPSGKSIQIRMIHCLNANGLGQPEGYIRVHSPLRPDMYGLYWLRFKKLTKKDNQWLLEFF